MELYASRCYRAMLARDARFDGRFFVVVPTTGIYCRPVSSSSSRSDACTGVSPDSIVPCTVSHDPAQRPFSLRRSARTSTPPPAPPPPRPAPPGRRSTYTSTNETRASVTATTPADLEPRQLLLQPLQAIARVLVALLLERLLLDLELDDAPVELVEFLGLAVDLH